MKITINLKGLEVVVEYEYYKPEPCIRYDEDLAGYPGSSAFLSIGNIFHGGINIYNFINEMDWWQLVEELVLQELEKYND